MKWIVATLRDCGVRFWRIGQQDARGTQDAGPADIVFFDRRRRVTVWIEAKREEGGRQSADQRDFQLEAEAAGDVYLLLNDQQVLIDFLTAPLPSPKEIR